jgi:hypothetical protein
MQNFFIQYIRKSKLKLEKRCQILANSIIYDKNRETTTLLTIQTVIKSTEIKIICLIKFASVGICMRSKIYNKTTSQKTKYFLLDNKIHRQPIILFSSSKIFRSSQKSLHDHPPKMNKKSHSTIKNALKYFFL